jgi:glutamine---fructose-6-phosphate transaminase (isomerizing)
MRDEIRQQPETLERTLKEEWSRAQALRRHFEQNAPRLIVLAARGTSDNAAQFGRYLLEITTGIPVSLAAPSVFTLYRAKVQLKDAVVVAISQSGESTDTNLVLEEARAAGAFTIGITNESESALARLAEHAFLVRAGKERSVAATKTYSGQLLCFYLLAHALGGAIELSELERVPGWTREALALEEEIRTRAERYCFMDHAVCVGRGLNYSNSFEFALKLMETCYVVAERFSPADLLHGPIAMLERSARRA